MLFDETSLELAKHVRRRGVRQWWRTDSNRELYFPGFARIIDRLMEEDDREAEAAVAP